MAAALALPGVAPGQTEDGPGPAVVGLKWLSYRDRQPGLDRIRVESPSMHWRLPVGDRWGLEGSVVQDEVSGASPRWHADVSGASRMDDRRRGGDVRVTRYGDRHAWSVGMASSDEDDFQSQAVSLTGRWSTADRNRVWNAGLALTRDRIGSTDDPTLDARRRTLETTVGVTQALSRTDLLQLGVTHASGQGHYSDPYKRPDLRPGSRHQTRLSIRWNHHFEPRDVTLRTSYRAYRDSFGIRSHTLSLEPVLGLGERWSLTPVLRLYSQSAARFYYDPVYSYVGAPYPPGYFDDPPTAVSADQRLSAFGAITLGWKIAAHLGQGWVVDLRLDRYEQRGRWRLGGDGSPGLPPFKARFVQVGISREL